MKFKKLAAALALAMLASSVHSHGQPKAQHGGVVATANDLTFELVAQGERTSLYVFDHGKAMDAKAFSGKLTVLTGTQRSEAELAAVGANRLDAAIPVSKGAKVVATLTVSGRSPMTVRFASK
jgi:hypothetical protein